MKLRSLCLSILLSSVSLSALAADSGGAFAVKGAGLVKCDLFVKAVKEKNQNALAVYVGWVAGFVSASNRSESETFDLVPWQSLQTLSSALLRHCERNPEERFATAVMRMVTTLKTGRIKERTQLVGLEMEDGKRLIVYKEVIRRVQVALTDFGFYSGDVNGEFGDEMRSALKNFQGERKLPESGLPDQRTMFELMKPKS